MTVSVLVSGCASTHLLREFSALNCVVSMLPLFFQETWGLTPVTAGLIAASFAFVNLFARADGWSSVGSDGQSAFRDALLYVWDRHRLCADGPSEQFVAADHRHRHNHRLLRSSCKGPRGRPSGIIPSIKRRVTGQNRGDGGRPTVMSAQSSTSSSSMFVDASTFFFINRGPAHCSPGSFA